MSPISDRGGLVDPAAESSSGSSRRPGSFAPLSSDSSLPSERCLSESFAVEVDFFSSGGDFFSDLSSSLAESFPVVTEYLNRVSIQIKVQGVRATEYLF